MTQTSWPFDGQATTEDQYGRLFREFSQSGVSASLGSNALEVTATGSSMNVQVAAGMAVVRGCMYRSTATENVLLAAPSSGTRIYMVALLLNQAANTITLTAIAGSGSSEPVVLDDMDTNDTGTFHVPLARVTVASSDTTINSSAIADRRRFVGRQVGAWSGPNSRPDNPRVGELGFSEALGDYEFWTGSDWQRVGEPAGTIKMFGGSTAPPGWLACGGGSVLVSSYPDLFAAIGYNFGGSGATFSLPNFTGRSPRHDASPGGTGGSGTVALDMANVPQHAHSINHDHASFTSGAGGAHDHQTKVNSNGAALGSGGSGWTYLRDIDDSSGSATANVMSDAATHTHAVDVPAFTGTSGNAGANSVTPINVTNPWLAVQFIIKT